MTYKITNPVGTVTNDPVLNILLSRCIRQQGGEIVMFYKTKLDLQIIAWTGFKPEIEGQITTKCPLNTATALGPLNTLLDGAGNVGNAIGGLLNGLT